MGSGLDETSKPAALTELWGEKAMIWGGGASSTMPGTGWLKSGRCYASTPRPCTILSWSLFLPQAFSSEACMYSVYTIRQKMSTWSLPTLHLET